MRCANRRAAPRCALALQQLPAVASHATCRPAQHSSCTYPHPTRITTHTAQRQAYGAPTVYQQQQYYGGPPPPQQQQQQQQQYYHQQQQQQQYLAPTTYSPSPQGAPQPGGGRKKAVLVGVSYAGTRSMLRGTINDVQCVRHCLVKK